ncbi:hypothetical protein QUC32_02440 [Novosphingobium resinovorum]|uniref:hypothetical protein n=1 Tax=Novosphingobium TaxID=165696 RepID=UPI001B3C4FF1|nr:MULTISPECIES: hypothetical protein [Novosphingobium]MBF7013698.1 hypothetical protein [Novosphingobium sp. HR1a]WJM25842.1 hypothetical protein QUC32_02440 [Novosphingobium resinovorum]
MNGIFSATPAPASIRLVIGSQGLLLVQSCIAWQLPAVPDQFRVLVGVTALVTLAALIGAAIGERGHHRPSPGRPRHGR